jgi:hypothetical protein
MPALYNLASRWLQTGRPRPSAVQGPMFLNEVTDGELLLRSPTTPFRRMGPVPDNALAVLDDVAFISKQPAVALQALAFTSCMMMLQHRCMPHSGRSIRLVP